MRLFIGVWLSEAARDEALRYIEFIKPGIPGFKWSAPGQLHFTLRFLGETPPGEVSRLTAVLQETAAGFSPFELRLGEPGRFPERGKPRILWLGASRGGEELTELAGAVEAACLSLGFPAADKPFWPHLTIARAKEGNGEARLPAAEFLGRSATLVTGFALIESILRPQGAVYREIAEFKFS